MSYDGKMAAACQVITQHNSSVPESIRLDWEKIKTAIISMGGTTEEALEAATWEDLQQCGIPRILARTIASAFRKVSKDLPTAKSISPQRAASMTFEELFGSYDPTGELNPTVFTRLEQLAMDKPVVIFTGGRADAVLSATRLRDIKTGFQPKDEVVIDGIVRSVYRIGDLPTAFVYENPLFPGEMLRPGHVCDTTERSWDGIQQVVRQTLYLAVAKTGELVIASPNDVHDVLDYVHGKPIETISARYPKATRMLRELQEAESAPSLRLKQGKKAAAKAAKKDDPFFGKHART